MHPLWSLGVRKDGLRDMKTVIRLRDDNGRIIGTAREEEQPSPTQVLVRFSVALAVLGLLLTLLI